jgi:hypothetical protein
LDRFIPKLGEVIPFGRTEQPKYLLNVSQGWSHPEPWGIWSDGGQNQVILGIPPVGARSLVISVRAFVTPSHPVQEIELTVNDQKRQDLVLTKDSNNQITIILTNADNEAGYLKIGFKFKTPLKPKDLGVGDDERLLAIGLEKAVFR